MTALKQWEKYITENPSGYGLPRFRIAVQRYRTVSNPALRIEHKSGDRMFIDCCGDKLWLLPFRGISPSGRSLCIGTRLYPAHLYVEATESQGREDFIQSCENALDCYGGVPQAIVADNLKSAVSKPGGYESTLNEEFARFAGHYGTVILPARVRKPKDRAHVENAVKLTCKEIYTEVEGLHCRDMKSLKAAIRSEMEKYNNKPLYGRNYSRRSYYEDMERETMGTLNPIRYQVKKTGHGNSRQVWLCPPQGRHSLLQRTPYPDRQKA
jgi:transposase